MNYASWHKHWCPEGCGKQVTNRFPTRREKKKHDLEGKDRVFECQRCHRVYLETEKGVACSFVEKRPELQERLEEVEV